MSDVLVYTTMFCPFCSRAKRLLREKGIDYREIDVEVTPGAREEMVRRAGGQRTVPQIFIDGNHVGGCDELYALEHDGRLDPLLKAS